MLHSHAAQELTRAELQARAEREQAAGHLNTIKLHNQWRKLMRAAKAEELRGQVEVLSQQHAREVDRKDAGVQVCGCAASPSAASARGRRLSSAMATAAAAAEQ